MPFEVLPQTTSLEVRIRYDGETAGIDLGCQGAAGCRGWSGGAPAEFVLNDERATPGYVAGPLEPGSWSVVLGLHTYPAHGVDIEVDLSMPATRPVPPERSREPREAVPASPRGSGRRLPTESGLTWFVGDFHAHSVHSDGRLSIDELAALAVRSGLDFLAVTDHNTVSHHRLLADAGAAHGITLLPGQEVTTHRGHANAFGDIGWIDFRRPAQHWLEEVERRGGILSINHPISGDCSWIHALSRRPAAVELWHSTWYRDMVSTAITGNVGHDGGALIPLEGVPAIVRVGTGVVAVRAEGHVLVDGRGRRRVVMDAEESFAADQAEGPFQLGVCSRSLHADNAVQSKSVPAIDSLPYKPCADGGVRAYGERISSAGGVPYNREQSDAHDDHTASKPTTNNIATGVSGSNDRPTRWVSYSGERHGVGCVGIRRRGIHRPRRQAESPR